MTECGMQAFVTDSEALGQMYSPPNRCISYFAKSITDMRYSITKLTKMRTCCTALKPLSQVVSIPRKAGSQIRHSRYKCVVHSLRSLSRWQTSLRDVRDIGGVIDLSGFVTVAFWVTNGRLPCHKWPPAVHLWSEPPQLVPDGQCDLGPAGIVKTTSAAA